MNYLLVNLLKEKKLMIQVIQILFLEIYYKDKKMA